MQNESLNCILGEFPNNGNQIIRDAILTEILINIQKTLEQSQQIKRSIQSLKVHPSIGSLLLLCSQLEEVNVALTNLKHEYNL